MQKFIALTVVQMAVSGKLAEIKPGQPLVLSDEKQIANLVELDAVRAPTEHELKTLFTNEPATADGSSVGVADLSKLTKDELIGYAAEKGITVDQKASKADILSAVEGHNALADEEL